MREGLRTRGISALFLVGLLVVFFAQPLAADDPLSGPWEFAITPYVWALSLDGDVTVRGFKTSADVGFNDIWDNLNFAAMVEAEVRKGRLGGFVDLVYGDIESKETVRDVAKVEATTRMSWVTFGTYYRLGPWGDGRGSAANGLSLTVDPYVGGRYTYLDAKLGFDNGPSRESDRDFVDPIIGTRLIAELYDPWVITVSGDIGGFGVGSDFSWQAIGLIGYRFSLFDDEDATAKFGYRALYQDYETGSGTDKFAWDVTAHGPVAGLTIKF